MAPIITIESYVYKTHFQGQDLWKIVSREDK